jgi:hypothetical protein
MVDCTDILEERKWLYEERAKRAITQLQKRNLNAQYVSNRKEALSSVLEMIPPGTVVARADSVTIDQIGIMEELRRRDQNKLIDPFAKDPQGRVIASREEGMRLRREAFLADLFLTGTNAITLDGKLVSTDGRGNRVAAMIFGPEKVIVVAGVNKIVNDVNEAFQRIRQVAAPMNGRRHHEKQGRTQHLDLPCMKTGVCVDCHHEWRMCLYTAIIEGTKGWQKGRINVVLVAEELGF